MSRGKRDEFSCPCCGVGTDSNYCADCEAAECGEQHVDSPEVCLARERCQVCGCVGSECACVNGPGTGAP